MTTSRQPDLFLPEVQADFFDEDAPTRVFRPDPERARANLHRILAEARAAKSLPWEPKTALLYQTIFPQMTNCLPPDEGEQLRFAFDAEIARLLAA